MTTPLFQPHGDKARWRAAYEALLEQGIDYGKTFSHEALAALLGLALEVFLRNRSPLYRLVNELEKEHGRTLVPIAGKGYRISSPEEHAALCRARRSKSRRLLRRGVDLIAATDQDKLSLHQRTELAKINGMLGLALITLSVHERRLNRHEEALRKAGLL
jgi:hypothetical protein